MDALRFDAVTRIWSAGGNRRRMGAGLLGIALGARALENSDDAAAAKSGKCPQPCGQCQRCKKGKCSKKNGKKRCQKGKCQNLERGTACAGGPGNCACVPAIEGDAFCAASVILLCDSACATSGDCPAGRRCARCGSGGDTACFPECGEA